MDKHLTPDGLRTLLWYDPKTGKLFWKTGRRAGKGDFATLEDAIAARKHGFIGD